MHYNQHADLLLIKGGEQLYIDVTVTRPTRESQLTHEQVRTTPLHSLVAIEQKKHRKYADICTVNGYAFTAFALESYGGVGTGAHQLLRTLAAHSKEMMTPREFLLHAYRRIACVLQQANANIALTGQQMLHLSRHSRRSQVHRVYHPPVHTDRLAMRVAPELSAAAADACADAYEGDVDQHTTGEDDMHTRGVGQRRAYGMRMYHADRRAPSPPHTRVPTVGGGTTDAGCSVPHPPTPHCASGTIHPDRMGQVPSGGAVVGMRIHTTRMDVPPSVTGGRSPLGA